MGGITCARRDAPRQRLEYHSGAGTSRPVVNLTRQRIATIAIWLPCRDQGHEWSLFGSRIPDAAGCQTRSYSQNNGTGLATVSNIGVPVSTTQDGSRPMRISAGVNSPFNNGTVYFSSQLHDTVVANETNGGTRIQKKDLVPRRVASLAAAREAVRLPSVRPPLRFV